MKDAKNAGCDAVKLQAFNEKVLGDKLPPDEVKEKEKKKEESKDVKETEEDNGEDEI